MYESMTLGVCSGEWTRFARMCLVLAFKTHVGVLALENVSTLDSGGALLEIQQYSINSRIKYERFKWSVRVIRAYTYTSQLDVS